MRICTDQYSHHSALLCRDMGGSLLIFKRLCIVSILLSALALGCLSLKDNWIIEAFR